MQRLRRGWTKFLRDMKKAPGLITGNLVTGKGEEARYCTLGWIGHRCGVSDQEMRDGRTKDDEDIYEHIYNLARERYEGLELDNLKMPPESTGYVAVTTIVDMNDNSRQVKDMPNGLGTTIDPEATKETLLKRLRKLPSYREVMQSGS